jgi:hypothetical protein
VWVADTGTGAAPFICVWDSVTLEIRYHIQVHEHDITAIAFNRVRSAALVPCALTDPFLVCLCE